MREGGLSDAEFAGRSAQAAFVRDRQHHFELGEFHMIDPFYHLVKFMISY